MDTDFKNALARFVTAAQAMINKHTAESFPNLRPDQLTIDPNGKKYIRIVSNNIAQDGTVCSRSVYCFVDSTNGDILKSASWKAPAKHARGNIMTEDKGVSSVTVYGAKYLR